MNQMSEPAIIKARAIYVRISHTDFAAILENESVELVKNIGNVVTVDNVVYQFRGWMAGEDFDRLITKLKQPVKSAGSIVFRLVEALPGIAVPRSGDVPFPPLRAAYILRWLEDFSRIGLPPATESFRQRRPGEKMLIDS